MDEEGLVGCGSGLRVGGEHLVNELAGGFALVFHGGGHAAAGVDQQAKAEGQVALAGEALDDLRAAVFGEGEVADGEGGDEAAVLVANDDRKDNLIGLDFERGGRCAGCGLLGVRGGMAEEAECGKGDGKGKLDAHGGHGRHSLTGLDGGAGGMLTAMAQRRRADVCCMNARVRRGRGWWQKRAARQRDQPKSHLP